MKLKAGDKLICKKCITECQDIDLFIVDKSYICTEEDSFFEIIYVNDEKDQSVIFSTNIFYGDKVKYVWEYFYTDKELRKLKLDEIKSR